MKSQKFFILAIFSLFLFFVLTYLVKLNFFYYLDYSVTSLFQNNLGSFFDLPFSVFSLLGSFEVTTLVWVVLFIFLLLKKRYLTALTSILFFGGLLTELLGKLEIYHKQPSVMMHRTITILPLPSSLITQAITDNSFPSGHILRTTFLVIILFFLFKHSNFKYKITMNIFLVIFLIIMFLSRIYLGEHWISDTIGGLLLGSSLAFIVLSTLVKKQKT